MRNTMRMGAVAAFVALALPAAASAQVCVGEPVGAGQSAIQFGVGFPGNDLTGYTGSVRTNPGGPLSYEAGYTYTTFGEGIDQKMHTIAAQAEYELPVQQLGMCPAAGLGWSTMSDDPSNLSMWSVPIGLGVGHEIPVGSGFSLTPHIMPMFVWQRVSFEEPLLGETISGSDSAFGFLGGLTFGTEAIFVAARATMTTFEGDDTSFSIEGGFLF